MLRFARRNAPSADFFAADACRLPLRASFDAAISTGDAINHLLKSEDLRAAFTGAFQCLAPQGVLVFDLNTAKAYHTQWGKSSTVAEPDNLLFVRGSYDRALKLGTTEITGFRLEDTWARVDITLRQRCYTRSEIRSALSECGFGRVTMHDARSLGMRGRLAIGRIFVMARKA
jgi:SAM-dependent methyltransferase